MTRTIGRRLRRQTVTDYEAICSICGTPWLRSDLTVDAEGRFRCPKDRAGRTALELSRADAAAMQALRYPAVVKDGITPQETSELFEAPSVMFEGNLATVWLEADRGVRAAGNQMRWENALRTPGRGPDGDLVAPLDADATQPIPDLIDDAFRFDFRPAWSNHGDLVNSDSATIYVVGSMDVSTSFFGGGLVSLELSAPSSEARGWDGTGQRRQLAIYQKSGRFWVSAHYDSLDQLDYLAASIPPNDGGRKMFRLQVKPRLVSLEVDGVVHEEDPGTASEADPPPPNRIPRLGHLIAGGRSIGPGEGGGTAFDFMQGTISMIVVVNGIPSDEQDAALKAYAAARWGVGA